MKRQLIAVSTVICLLLCAAVSTPSAFASDPCYINATQAGAEKKLLDSDCDGLPE